MKFKQRTDAKIKAKIRSDNNIQWRAIEKSPILLLQKQLNLIASKLFGIFWCPNIIFSDWIFEYIVPGFPLQKDGADPRIFEAE